MNRKIAKEFKIFIHYVDTCGDFWLLNKDKNDGVHVHTRWRCAQVLKSLRRRHPLSLLEMSALYTEEWFGVVGHYDREFNQLLKDAYCEQAESEFLYGQYNNKLFNKGGIIRAIKRIFG